MIVYLDMCCLKRPFDSQSRPQIALETAAVLAILQAVDEGRAQAVRSVVHDLENSRNPDKRRAATVAAWLSSLNPTQETPQPVADLLHRLIQAGLPSLDAFHLAWAEHLRADVLVTTDSRFLSKCQALGDRIRVRVRVVSPLALVEELGT